MSDQLCLHLSLRVILLQASEEASLRALESLMTEFFHNCTTNERKREIGTFCHATPLLLVRYRSSQVMLCHKVGLVLGSKSQIIIFFFFTQSNYLEVRRQMVRLLFIQSSPNTSII